MVAIVAGNGLGLFNASVNSLGGSGVGGQGNLGQAGGQALVNVSNGNLVLRFTDEQLSGLGQDLLHTRTYNTQGGLSDGDADGWRWDGERSLLLTGTVNTSGSQVTRTMGDGHQTVYQWNGSRYQSTEGDGAHDTVTWDAGAGQMVWTDGSRRTVERYDDNGRLLSVTDANGTQISYGYDANGRLNSVQDSSGQELVLSYNASGKLERVDTRNAAGGALTQQVYYGYDAQGRLINVSTDLSPEDNSIADGKVYRTDYTYDGASFRIASVVQSDGTSASFTYQLRDGEYRVKTVSDGSGTTTFSYDIASNRTDVLNGSGQQWSYFYDTNDRLIEVRTPAVDGQRLSTRYAYDSDSNVIKVTDGRGNAVTYQYDASGNVLLERDATGATVARSYSADNQLLNEIRYIATATLNAVTGSWTEPPASTAQVTRLAYDSNNRVRFMVDGRGQVTEYRYNAQGLRTQEIAYGDALFVLTGLTPQDVLTESQLMTWAGSRDRTRSTLTELSYDYRGNLSRRVVYGSVNAAGTGIQESSTSVTEYVYSQHGQLLQTFVVRAADRSRKITLSSVVYDGLGRVISQTDSAGTRTTAYNGTGRTVAVTNSAGMTITQTYNDRGQLLGLTQTAAGLASRSTSYVYDDAGRQVMVQDATGVRSYTFYDEAGRVSALVDGLGAVTEYSYNAAGQRTQEKRYATLVDTSAWYDGTAVLKKQVDEVRPVSASADRTTVLSYDNAGRLSASTDASGTLTTFTYDGQGRLIKQQTGDRATRFFYDASGHQIGQLDAEGYLREDRHDAAGRLTQSIRYANATVLANRATGTLVGLRPPSAGDLTSWYFYDTAGRQIGSVDEKQFVTETVYDEAGNTQKTIRYATAYTAAISAATTFATIKSGVAAGAAQTATTTFDDQGRVALRVATDGTATAYEYDSAGRLVRETQAQGTTEERSTRTRYDAFGQTIGKLLGEASGRVTTGMSATEVAAIYAQYGLTYQYDAAGRVASATDALGNRTLSYYDAAGRLTHVVNAMGEVSETVYSAFGDVRERTDFTGRLATADTAALSGGVLNAQLKTLVQAIRNATNDNRRVYGYDNRGLLTSSTDAMGYVTGYGYNAFGNQTSVTRTIATGNTIVSSITYNKRGEQISRIDDVGGLARSSATVYDAFGRVISQVDGRGLTSTTTYASNGRVIVSRNALNQGQISEYDAFGRVLKQTDALGKVTTYAYNDSTRSLTVTTPDGVSVVTLKNRHGQTLTVTNGTGAVTRYSYNKEGQLVTSQDALNRTTTNAYDEAGRLLTVTDALGRISRYGYDAANRVLTRTDANNSVTRYSFDGQGRQVRVVDAEGKTEQRITDYAYDRKGQLLRVTQDPNGLKLTTSYSYDGVGQQVQVMRGTVASPSQQVTLYAFDKLGRRTSERQDPSGLNLTTRYSYNENDQVTRKIDAAGNSTWYVYDAAGRVSATVDALGYVSENKYDANGRVVETVRHAKPIQVPTVGSSDGQTLSLSGNSRLLTALDKIAIDPAKTYTVRVKLRQLTGEGSVYAGVVTYDSAGNKLANASGGTFSYNAASAVKLTPEMGWQTFEGTISGTSPNSGGANRNKFIEGSASAVPLLLYNYGVDSSGDPTRLIEVDSLELIDTATGQVLNANAKADAGQVNWSVAGPVGIHEGSDALSAENLQALLRPDSDDRHTQFVYDAVGRQRYVIDAQGAVTENKYDANGRLTQTVQYATRIQRPTYGSSDGSTLSLSGNSGIFTALEKIAIDPAKTYTVRVKLRQVTGEGLVYAGVVTYDSAGNKLANTSGGTFSYNAASAVKLTPEMGWQTFEGTISGTSPNSGGVNRNKFIEGSASAVPLLLYNYGVDSSGDPSRLIEVDSLELIDTATGQVLNVNANIDAGQANWSVAGVNGVHSASDALSVEQLQKLLRPESAGDRTTTYTYDAAGQQKTVTDAAGKVESYTYDAVGNRKTLTNKNGHVWTYNYDVLNRLVEEITPAVAVASITEAGVVSAVNRYLVTRNTYDALGNVTSRTEGRLRASVAADPSLDELTEARTTAYAYDAIGRQIRITSPGWYNKLSGRYQQASDGTANTFQVSTEVTYDSLGNAVRNRVRVNNSGVAATDFVDSYKVYDVLGRVSYDIGGLKGVTAYSYDGLGQTIRTVRYANALTQAVPARGYYLSTDVTATTLVPDATQDRTLITSYDALGRKTAVQKNIVSLFTFTGNVATSTLTNLAPTTLYSYDAFGQLVRETQVARNASGATVQTGASSVYYYDMGGQRIGSVDALGYYTRMEYDALGQLTRQTDYATKLASWNENALPAVPTASINDRRVRFSYDAMGRLSQTTVEGARFWQQSINATTGAVSATLVTADLSLSRSTYDGVGNVKTVTDAQGNVVSTDYNALGQVIKVTEPARATAKNGAVDPFASAEVIASPTTTLLLNAFGQQIREVRAVGTDSAGNVQAGLGQITRTRYDAVGHEIQEIDAAGSAQNYKVDVAGRRIEESRTVNATLSAWTAGGVAVSYNQTLKRTFQYDALGQQTATIDWYTAANGTAQNTSDSVIFNRFGEVTRKLLNGNTVEIFNYDQAGRLESHGSSTDLSAFQYDLSDKVSKSTATGDWSTTADDRINYMRNDLLGRTYEQHLPAFEANLNADTLNNVTLTLSTPIIRQTLDRWGNVLSRTDARGYITTYTYDHNNKQLTETLPVTDILRENGTSYRGSLIHEKRYDALGQLIQEVDLIGPYTGVVTNTLLRTRQHVYNQIGQLIRDIDALGYSRDYRVDANGNRIATRDALGIVMVDGYDAMDRHINHGIIRSGAKVTLLTNQYDQAGRLYGEISGAGAVEETLQSVANTSNWTSTTTGVAGNTKYSLFDERGNVVKTRNESKVERTIEYDANNRKVKETDGLNGTLTWTYDIASLGRLSSRKDLGGRVYSFTYNGFGQLIKETLTTASGAGPDKTYSYYANGLTKAIVEGTVTKDTAGAVTAEDSRTSTYTYDLGGNRVNEINSGRYLKGTVSQASSNEVRSRFDEQSRLKEVKAPAGNQLMGGLGTQYALATTARLDSLKYDYDEVGNRRRVYMDTTNQSGGRTIKDDWYKYDLEGRALIAEGFINAKGQIVAGALGPGLTVATANAKGYALTYNAIGQRVSSESWKEFIYQTIYNPLIPTGQFVVPAAHRYEVETYSYNSFGQLESAVGRAVARQYTNGKSDISEVVVDLTKVASFPAAELLQTKYSKVYDEKGNLVSQKTHKFNLNWVALTNQSTINYVYRGDGQLISQSTYDSAQRLAQANYFNESGMLDAAGNQRAYRYVSYNANGTINHRGSFSAGQVLFDGYKESQSTVTRTNGGSPGTTTYTYSARGELLQAIGTGGNVFTRRLATNDEGRLITRQESSGKAQTYLYYQGAALANFGNASAPEISDTFTPISTDYPERTPSNYVVNQGDTLESIAQSVWGDSKMWYLIADANGLDPSKALNPGDNLKIPNVVSSTHNDATTFKPYSPDDVIGNTAPTPKAPPPPKPKKKKSGGLASVVMVVVAVVATVFTAGAATAVISGAASTLGGAAAAGTAALSAAAAGTAATISLGGAIVGAAVGSAASQLVGMGMGAVDKFSWGQVAASGITGGLTYGITSGIGTLAQGAQPGSWAQIAASAARTYSAQGVFNYAASQMAYRIVGLDTSFSWNRLASSVVAANVSGQLNGRLGNQLSGQIVSGQIGAYASAAISDKWLGGSRPNHGQIAADAFGNTLGNFFVDQFGESSAEAVQRTMKLAGLPDDDVYRDAVGRGLANGVPPEQLAEFFTHPGTREVALHPMRPGENGELLTYEGNGVWVGVPPPQEPITYSIGDLQGAASINGNSTWVDWANDFTPVVHERLVGFGQFAAEHEGATKLLSFAAETVSYALMGWMRAGLSIATEAVLGAAKSQVRDYAIERVGDYYQSKGVSTDNAGILASGTVFGAEVAIGEVGSAVKGAQRYAMRMDGKIGTNTTDGIVSPASIISSGTTRTGLVRTNAADWRALRNDWDDLGYGQILSTENRASIAKGRPPKVDDTWIKVFPEDAGLLGEKISMHHIQGLPLTVPLPATRHLDAHMPGGFRYNPGGPGSALPAYPPKQGVK
ncbi:MULTISPECIES: LysM peptidoglycan-binding domain-containing protein [unclassified Pseudomonas]|uniref:LysM peptidoglycan-binding domain-containing protein n=1 Tax=unclassified Pseudomonas TaxID=196821 RepID=UPI000877429B|nr:MULTISPECIES: LysM peptidoglycan-binding domain-containing protein [unclassified Pseudomonas]SCZ19763.1 YD repeat-containing protein [Pseudomonas sp. NFACC44-2]SDA45725.1 YD repeat-containing protein [Pseudomonas sp. NFACC51]SEI44822.1 YD repeat-containing protein [Pseudomonas sp. NFACC07-1]SFH05346.1 YD repeat-containing protein [Pseudomonas sp. NFACC54]SFS39822.1 YD repeat-containing protein [Pseudomonas sp. NFACC48-1]